MFLPPKINYLCNRILFPTAVCAAYPKYSCTQNAFPLQAMLSPVYKCSIGISNRVYAGYIFLMGLNAHVRPPYHVPAGSAPFSSAGSQIIIPVILVFLHWQITPVFFRKPAFISDIQNHLIYKYSSQCYTEEKWR